MTKLILIALIAIGLQAGGIWDMVKNAGSKGTIKTKQYSISVAGVNTRGYVMNIKDMKSICFLTYSSQGFPAMVCKTYKEMGVKE